MARKKLILNGKTYKYFKTRREYQQRMNQITDVVEALMYGINLHTTKHLNGDETAEPYMDAEYLQNPNLFDIRDIMSLPQRTDGDLVHDPEFERVDNMIKAMCKAFYIGLYGTQYGNNK